jgi:hypothetical protein
MTNCTDWDYVQVRDFDVLGQLYDQYAKKFENDLNGLVEETHMLGNKNKVELGIAWPVLDEDTSKYVFDVYTETINLCATYYHVTRNV